MDTYFEVVVPYDVYDEFVSVVSRLGVDIMAEYEVTD